MKLVQKRSSYSATNSMYLFAILTLKKYTNKLKKSTLSCLTEDSKQRNDGLSTAEMCFPILMLSMFDVGRHIIVISDCSIRVSRVIGATK